MIDPKDLKIETYDPYPVGGMRVGYTMRGVRISHIPSGITVQIDYSRSQHHARAFLIRILEDALTDPLYDRVRQ